MDPLARPVGMVELILYIVQRGDEADRSTVRTSTAMGAIVDVRKLKCTKSETVFVFRMCFSVLLLLLLVSAYPTSSPSQHNSSCCCSHTRQYTRRHGDTKYRLQYRPHKPLASRLCIPQRLFSNGLEHACAQRTCGQRDIDDAIQHPHGSRAHTMLGAPCCASVLPCALPNTQAPSATPGAHCSTCSIHCTDSRAPCRF